MAAALMAGGSAASAQEPAPEPRPQLAATLSVRFPIAMTPPWGQESQAPAPAAASAPPPAQDAGVRRSAAGDPRRDDVHMMEALLTQALQKGAQDLARQLKVSEPNSAFVTSTGRARGFALDGYGMFFDVDVPGMKQSVVWSAQMLELAQQREQLRRFVLENPAHPARRLAEANLRQIERMMIGLTSPSAMPSPSPQEPARGMAVAQNLNDTATVPSAASAPIADLRDPNELYTDSVKNALIEAMLKYSGFLKIKDDEWLTVAASDSDGPQTPGQLDDAFSIVIRVKGRDLVAFQAGKLTREEVLKRVEVKEF